LLDRLVLTPMEINPVMKKYPGSPGGAFALRACANGHFVQQAWQGGMPFLALGLAAVFAGAFGAGPASFRSVPLRLRAGS
jgi:hypothetical protein